MYVCTHMYVHMWYVLIRPPIPYITSSRCKRLHKFRPIEILLHVRGYPRVPPCNVLKKCLFFFTAITLYFWVLLKFCFTREGAQGSPLVTYLQNVFFFFKAITLYFYVLFKYCLTREGAKGPPLVNPINNVFFKFMMQITS